ncbi:DUF4190 domain-containing protein [Homoserinimonas hongtaonis]|uniref:DUF4190 domain-containing protein n=1 Tax=Homoserinimonas hongtaonis TaxID=2079791 RepID=UPI0011B1DD01|nr:DUF4190 domain-containing protein [Salinibacterium hongtaonis]
MTDNSNSEVPPVPPAGSAPSPDEPRLPASGPAAPSSAASASSQPTPPPPPASSPPQQSYSPYASTTASEPKGLSIASMVAGIGGLVLSFAGIGILAAIAAVICGHLAQKREPYARPFWLTGLITGYVGIGLAVLFLLLLLPFVLLFFAGLGGGWDSYNY